MNLDNLDRNFSTYIRLRDRLKGSELIKCISCGKIVDWKESDCGHFVNRKHMSTRFLEKNCNAQCRSCNRFDEGNLPEYALGLEKKYGVGTVEQLCIIKHYSVKYSQREIDELNKYYLKLIKEIK